MSQEGSEFHTASEFAPDFDSDNEPPVDKKLEKKLFHKTAKLRLYKRILTVPKKSLELPAKYDRVDVKFLECESENLDPSALEKVAVSHWQLGITMLPEAVLISVTSMKRGEVSIFENEQVIYDPATKERKLIGKSYFMLELIDFVTIIDLFGDNNVYKTQVEKGVGIDRLMKCDKVRMDLRIYNSKKEIIWERMDDGTPRELHELVDTVFEGLPLPGLKEFKIQATEIFQTFKDREQSYIDFEDPTKVIVERSVEKEIADEKTQDSKVCIPNETEPKVELFRIRDLSIFTRPNRLYLWVNVLENARLDDIFGDGSVLKKTVKTGISTASPEQLSLVFFDVRIKVNGTVIASSYINSL